MCLGEAGMPAIHVDLENSDNNPPRWSCGEPPGFRQTVRKAVSLAIASLWPTLASIRIAGRLRIVRNHLGQSILSAV
jgi:hypothetical protein